MEVWVDTRIRNEGFGSGVTRKSCLIFSLGGVCECIRRTRVTKLTVLIQSHIHVVRPSWMHSDLGIICVHTMKGAAMRSFQCNSWDVLDDHFPQTLQSFSKRDACRDPGVFHLRKISFLKRPCMTDVLTKKKLRAATQAASNASRSSKNYEEQNLRLIQARRQGDWRRKRCSVEGEGFYIG